MQDQFKWLFVLCSLEIIFSFLIKISSLKALEIEFAFFSSPWESRPCIFSVATNLENMENLEKSGNLKIVKNSGKLGFLWIKTWKTQRKCKICDINVNKNLFQQTFLSELLRKKFENTLENLRENSGNL